MKQKRKVKSLFPQKKDYASLVTTLLLILSLLLCIGTAALVTSFALASNNNDIETYKFKYEGIDNQREVVYGIKFADPSNMRKITNNIFVQSGTLYISPNPVVVNPPTSDGSGIDRTSNVVENGINSCILGGKNNKVKSQNINLIAGEGIEVESGNNNASILGGDGNKFHQYINSPSLRDRYYRFPLVSIGGKNNSGIKALFGAVFIGGSGNEIGSWNEINGLGSNLFIIGGENNKITNSQSFPNVIIGGKNIKISQKTNVFAYSNSNDDFTPQSRNAFYLNMEKGVGVNTTGGSEALFVNGGVYIGEVDIVHSPCKSVNYGIVGSYQGCLVGCTKVSSESSSSWEMLDLGNKCKEICEDSTKCVSPTDTASADEEENKIYIDAQCTNNVDTGNAKICSRDKNFESGYLEFYKNVIFETTLLDSDQPCPEGQENQCIYKCDPDYHLTGNAADGTLKCHKDCELPWNKTIKKKHSDTIEAYNITGVSCSNDIYVFPLNTQIINAGFPALSPTGLSRGTVQVYNVLYPNRATNGRSPETCDNYDHKKTLICQEGNWYIMKENGQPITSDEGKRWVEDYQYESCNLSSYSCDTSVYSLTRHDVDSIEAGLTQNIWNTTPDRGVINGTRGIYKLCKDYTANQGNKSCTSTNNDPNTHFQLVGCQAHYSTGDKPGEDDWKYICKQDCTLKNKNGDTVYYRHNNMVTGYKSGSVVCTATDKCESVSLICRDGQWYNSVSYPQGNPVTDYNYNVCELKNKECEGYNVSEATYNQYKDTSEYIPCDLYNADTNRNVCIPNGTKYKLVGCNSGYHANSSKTHCIPNVEIRDCTNKWTGEHGYWIHHIGNTTDYPWHTELKNEVINLEMGKYIARWDGEWDEGDWTWMYPENACDRDCEGGWQKSRDGKKCVINKCNGDIPNGIGVNTGTDQPGGNRDKEWTYKTGATATELSACEWSCQIKYHRKPNTNTCEFNEKTVRCITGGVIPENSDYVITGVTVTWDSTGNKWGDIDPCDWKCNEPDYILNEAHTGCILKPSCPAGKYLDEENHCEFTPPGTYSPDGDINKYNCPAGKHSNAAATSAEECWSYADLDVYIVGPDSGVKSYSLMDRNLGATEIYNGDIDHPNVASYGYHYQWGNNYGFLPCTTNGCTEFPNGESSSASPVSDPDPKYIPSKYINNVYITADNYLTNWNNNSNQGYNRVKNLWGGADSSYLLKQGPCPLGYHVPSQGDLKDLVSSWRLANNLGSDNQDLLELLDYDYNKSQSMIDEGDINFMKDFIIPPAGERNIYTYHVSQLGNEYGLWSSSIEVLEGNVHNVYLGGIDINKPLFHHIANSVRCIKNTKNKRTTIEPNGGTGAVISIVGGKIHSLGTPSKEGKVFQGWYADPSFTQKVQTGSQATQYLYAKWTDEASEDIETYLIPGLDINEAMRRVTNRIQKQNIKYFKRSTTDNHEDAEYGFDEIQMDGYPEVYLWYDPDDKTIYYYTDATTIYMNPDSSSMFEYFGDLGYYEYGALETIDLSDLNMSKVTNMSRMFYNCRNLKSIKLGPDFDTSIVTDMSYLFSSCSSLTNTGLDLSKFDTRNVVDMSSMFAGCSSIKHLNLSLYENFRTNNVTNMESMFAGGPELTCNSLSKFNTSKVENMSMMFQGTPSKSLDLTSFDTSKVTQMLSMFSNSQLITVDLTSFDTSIVVNMDDMFANSSNLTRIYASDFDTSSLNGKSYYFAGNRPSPGYYDYNYNGMFKGCSALIGEESRVVCDDWRKQYYAQNPNFYNGGCDAATNAKVTGGYFTAKDDSLGDFCAGAVDNSARLVEGYEINRKMVDLAGGEENIEGFKEYNIDLDEEPLPSGTRTEKISVPRSRRDVIIWYDEGDKTIYYYTKADKIYMNPDSSRMFEGLYNLGGIDMTANADYYSHVKWDTSEVENMSRMFKDCDSLVDVYSIQPLETWDTSSVEDMSSMFAGCYNLQELSPLSSWDTSSVENMSSMFSHCDENKNCTYENPVNISPLSNWNTSSVKNMSSMFEGFWFHYNDGIDPLSGWDTSSVENMSYMFYDINEFYDVDALSNWDTSSVKDMSHMFENCFELGSIHLEWNTSNVENMNSMFRGCDFGEAVTKKTPDNGDDVLLSGWDTSKVKDMSNMFSLNNSIEYVELNGWDTSSVENMSSMFSNCISLKDIIINEWDTSSVKDMSSMFNMCTDLETLNLNSRDTSSVTNMSAMFMECNDENGIGCSKKLKKIYASEYFVTDNVSDSENMFYGTPYLKGGYGTVYDVSHRNKEYARIDKEGQKGYFTYKTPTPVDGVCGTRPYTCESGKLDFSNYDGPVLNRHYTVGETPYISGYQWDCNGKFSGDNAIGCVTCDDDNYVRDGEKCTYKPRRYYCAVYDPFRESIKAVDVCTIKNEDNKLFCINEDNPDCDGPAYNNTCCYWQAWANYPDYVNPFPNPAGKEEVKYFGTMLEYRSLYEYFAPVKNNDGVFENIIPIEFDFGIWHYGNYGVAPREMGYREQTQ